MSKIHWSKADPIEKFNRFAEKLQVSKQQGGRKFVMLGKQGQEMRSFSRDEILERFKSCLKKVTSDPRIANQIPLKQEIGNNWYSFLQSDFDKVKDLTEIYRCHIENFEASRPVKPKN